MKAPPLLSSHNDQPPPLMLGLATVALCLLIGVNALTLVCSVASAFAQSKGDGVLIGSVIFVLVGVAVLLSLLPLPAAIRYKHPVWPKVAVFLGFTPLPLMFVVVHIVRALRDV